MSKDLKVIVEESGLEQSKAQVLLEKFQDYFKLADEWEKKAKAVVVTDASQIAEMKMAREGRLFLKGKRVDIENTRKKLKEQSLREGKAIDGIANILKAVIVPVEEHLEKQEKFAEIQEEKRKDALRLERLEVLEKYDYVEEHDLRELQDDLFQALVDKLEKEKQERIQAEKQEAEERARIREENERLRKEAEEKEKALAEERKRVEEERLKAEAEARAEQEKLRKEAEEMLKAEREKAEAQAKKDREAAEKVRAELEAKISETTKHRITCPHCKKTFTLENKNE